MTESELEEQAFNDALDAHPEDHTTRLAEIRQRFGVSHVVVNPKYPACAVSQCGRVFSWSVTTRHRAGQVRELALSRHCGGYRYVRFPHKGKSVMVMTHRLVAECYLPPPKPGQNIVRHLNGDPTDNRPENLAWGTQADNMADCVRHGRTLRGRKSPQAKLTLRLALAIRILAEHGYSQDAIATFIGIQQGTVSRVVLGKSWGEQES